jgi:transcription antitermination factor NusG
MMQFPFLAPVACLPWSLIVTGSNMEERVQTKLIAAGWQTYLPKRVRLEWPAKRDRRVPVARPLFARYFFATCGEDGDVEATRDLRGLVAVRRFREGRASIIRPKLMLRLMVAEAAGAFDDTREAVRPAVVCGARVKLMGTALSGFEARIHQVLSQREVVAAIDFFGRELLATCPVSELQMLDLEQAA